MNVRRDEINYAMLFSWKMMVGEQGPPVATCNHPSGWVDRKFGQMRWAVVAVANVRAWNGRWNTCHDSFGHLTFSSIWLFKHTVLWLFVGPNHSRWRWRVRVWATPLLPFRVMGWQGYDDVVRRCTIKRRDGKNFGLLENESSPFTCWWTKGDTSRSFSDILGAQQHKFVL